MNIILYTTHCPACKVLESKLRNKNISFIEETNIDIMRQKGFMSVPYLEIDGKTLNFKAAVDWINNLQEDKK